MVHRRPSRRLGLLAIASALTLGLAACGGGGSGDGSGGSGKVTIAVGGQSQVVYLPTTLAQQLGYYKDEGLDVTINDFEGGSEALEAMLGGSADVTSGFYDHTIEMATKHKELEAFVDMLRYPDLVLAVSPKAGQDISSVADLKGKTVGITAPGSSTQFFTQYLLAKNGMSQDAVSFKGMGAASTAVAAMEKGQVDAGVMVDPAFSQLQNRQNGNVTVLADTRSGSDVQRVFGTSTYPAATLYATTDWVEGNTSTAKKLAKAIVRTLKWIDSHSAKQIAAKMPKEFAGGDPSLYQQAIDNAKASYSPDGVMHKDGTESVLEVLGTGIPEVKKADVDITQTYTNEFVQ